MGTTLSPFGHEFDADLRLAAKKTSQAVTLQRATAHNRIWTTSWIPFLQRAGIGDPYLTSIQDTVQILIVYSMRVRDGRAARGHRPVLASSVRDYVFQVSKTFTLLAKRDPRLDASGELDPRLTWLWRAMKKEDPPPTRVKPMPLQVLQEAHHHTNGNADMRSLLDCAYVGFFFMLRAGEYLDTSSGEDRPILLNQIHFASHNGAAIPAHTGPLTSLHQCSYASITFIDQKNGHKGQTVAHHTSGHPTCCPVRALLRRVHYLREHNAPPNTPISATFLNGHFLVPKTHQLTALLRQAAQRSSTITYKPSDISPRSLRSGGAMALLLAGVDKTIIQLVGRWTSDALFSYLHSFALPLIKDHSSKMLRHGTFTVINADLTLPQAEAILATDFIHDDDDSVT